MNIIITAGGTTEPIDSIRSITNKSSGALGKKILDEYLIAFPDASIYYLHGKYAHKFEHPPDNVKQIEIASTNSLINEVASLLSNEPIDLFIHSMAVADYTTNNVNEK